MYLLAQLFLVVILSIGSTVTAFANIYKCTTPAGKTFYSEKVCAADSISAIIESESQTNNATVTTPSSSSKTQTNNTTKTTSSSSPDVDIYITSWCPYCKRAMAYLDAQGVYYHKYDIEEDAEAAVRKRSIAPNNSGVPVTVINGQIINGYSEQRFKQALRQQTQLQ